MRKLLLLSIFFLIGISAQAQRYDIITQDICWNTGSVDSSLTRYLLVSPLASTVKVLAHLNSAGQKVVPSGGTFSAGHCGCCGDVSTSTTTTTSTPARSGLLNDNDTLKLGGLAQEDIAIGGMGQYGMDMTDWKYLNFSASDSFKIITPGLIDAAIDVGGLLQVNSLTGRVEFTPYAFPLTAGLDGQFQQYNSATNQMEWRSPYVTAVETDSSYRFSVNGSSVSEVSKPKEIFLDFHSQIPIGTYQLGDIIKTKAFSTINDGGHATYIVQSDSIVARIGVDSLSVIPVNSGYAILQPREDGAIYVEQFGANGFDGANYDDEAIQACVDAAMYYDITSHIKLGPGEFYTRGITVAYDRLSDGNYDFVTLTIEGAVSAYSNTQNIGKTSALVVEGNSYGIGVMFARQVVIKNIFFNGAQNFVSIKNTIEWNDTTYTNNSNVRTNTLSPHAGIVTDVFDSRVASADRYPNRTLYYTSTQNSGSSMIRIEGCGFQNFDVGVAHGISGIATVQNGDNLVIENFSANGCRVFFAPGQSQTRGNLITEGYVTGRMQYFINTSRYGVGNGAPPVVENVNFAGGIKNFIYTNNNNKLRANSLYFEGLWSIGTAIGQQGIDLVNCQFKLMTPYFEDTFFPQRHLTFGGTANFIGGSIEYFQNDQITYPIVVTGGRANFVGVSFESGPVVSSASSGDETVINLVNCNNKAYGQSFGGGWGKLNQFSRTVLNRRYMHPDYKVMDDKRIIYDPKFTKPFLNYYLENVTWTKSEEYAYFIPTDVGRYQVLDAFTTYETYPDTSNLAPNRTGAIGFVYEIVGDTVKCRVSNVINTGETTQLYLSEIPLIFPRVFGDITSGSNIITNVVKPGNISGFAAGDKIFGEGIPTGTYVSSVNYGAGTITLSSNPTKSTTNTLVYNAPFRQSKEISYFLVSDVGSINGIPTQTAWAIGDELINDLSVDTTISKYICIENGVYGSSKEPRWKIIYNSTKQENVEGITNPQGGANTIQAALDSLNAHITALEAAAPNPTVQGNSPTATSGTTLVITHNLGSFPSAIHITPAGDIGKWYLSGINTTTMTLNYETVTPSAVTIYWQVE